ncbi:hypothetical protein AAEX28_01470 [Lentisphaerota bacterium WC36G]|nr:hypothetical protein LJT99_04355 [Lentisphaerae bacterium WC36]
MVMYDNARGPWTAGDITIADVQFTGKVFPDKTVDASKIIAEDKKASEIKKYVDKVKNSKTLINSIEYLANTYQHYNKEKYISLVEKFDKTIDNSNITYKDYERFLALTKEVLLSHPLMQKYPLLYNKRAQYLEDHHNTATMFQKGEINTNKFRGNSSFKVIKFSDGQNPTPKILLDKGENFAVRDPEISYDGKDIIFSMRNGKRGSYHIYRMNIDGTNIKQLTKNNFVSDIDPVFLPDGKIVFSSTREPKYCMCNRHIMANLYKMDGDGANIHQIGKSSLFEGHSVVLPDGRILYDRWEYVDRNFGDAQALWTVNPDGTNHALYWGNNTASPGGVIDGRPIPDTDLVVCVFAACHDVPWGALAIIDNKKAYDGEKAVVQIWPKEIRRYISIEGEGLDAFRRMKIKYEDPYPIDSHFILASRMTGNRHQTAIVLLDRFGNEAEILRDGAGCFDPMLIRPTKKPNVIAERRNYENKEAKVYVQDVYTGTHLKGVKRGDAKYIRVASSLEKRAYDRGAWDGYGVQAPAINWEDYSVKRVLGVVPVEDDGSAYFSIPSDSFVFFQLLDKDKKMIQTMRSGTIFQSGETFGCVGCHESRIEDAPHMSGRLKALTKAPHKLNGNAKGEFTSVNYAKDVQPIFDKHCVNCHDFDKPAGNKLILAGDKGLIFNASYRDLQQKKYISTIGAGPAELLNAYTWGSTQSKIVQLIDAKHKGVKLSQLEKNVINEWIDMNATYYPTYYFTNGYSGNLGGRCPLNSKELNRLSRLSKVPFVSLQSKIKSLNLGLGPQISFTRPEISPILKRFEKDSPEYKEALAIITLGSNRLKANPRADMNNFKMGKRSTNFENRYQKFRKLEKKNRDAIREGEKNYDK